MYNCQMNIYLTHFYTLFTFQKILLNIAMLKLNVIWHQYGLRPANTSVHVDHALYYSFLILKSLRFWQDKG